MSFIEYEESQRGDMWQMSSLHSHSHYELYILQSGERTFFLQNSMLDMTSGTMVVIPPFVMHKTEGSAFKRININLSKDLFAEGELTILNELNKCGVIKLETIPNCTAMLKEIALLYQHNTPRAKVLLNIAIKYFIMQTYISNKENVDNSILNGQKQLPEVVIKIMHHINQNLDKKLNQQTIATQFYLNQGYVGKLFYKHTHVALSEYILQQRINSSKALLKNTNKSVQIISEECGFSSANYFALIFKKRVGISALSWRKHERAKS